MHAHSQVDYYQIRVCRQIDGGAFDFHSQLGTLYFTGYCTGAALFLGPRAQQAAQDHELSQVVGIVVSQQQRFSQNGLAVAVRYLLEEIG